MNNYVFCHNCGKRIPANSVTCPYCGAKVTQYDNEGHVGRVPKRIIPKQNRMMPNNYGYKRPQFKQYNFYKGNTDANPGSENICVRNSTATIIINIILLIVGLFILGWPCGIIVSVTGSMLKKSKKTYTAGSIFFILGLIWIGLGVIATLIYL